MIRIREEMGFLAGVFFSDYFIFLEFCRVLYIESLAGVFEGLGVFLGLVFYKFLVSVVFIEMRFILLGVMVVFF